MIKKILMGLSLCLSTQVQALTLPQEKQYQSFVKELRCLVCQNQSLEDSQARWALDLKGDLREKIAQGVPLLKIQKDLRESYGDFIFFKPPVKPSTWALWVGPFLILGLLIYLVCRRLRVFQC